MVKVYSTTRVSSSGKRRTLTKRKAGLSSREKKKREEERKKKVKVVKKTIQPTKQKPVTKPSVIKLKPKEKKKTTLGQKIKGIVTAPYKAFAESTAEVIPTTPEKALKLGGRVLTGISVGVGGTAALLPKIAKPSVATISASVHAHKLITTKAGAEKLIGIGTRTATRSFVGKPASSGVLKLFKAGSKSAPVAARYATNTKSMGLTSKMLIAAGLSLGAVSIARDIIGTYPFASFGKEEALQVTNFPISKLIDRGLIDEAETLINISDEIINTVPSKIPYKNVLQEFRQYVKAQEKANEGWRSVIEYERNKVPEEDKWAAIHEEQAAREEESRQKDLEEMEWKAEYYGLLREFKYEEAEELLQSKLEGGKENE